MAEGEGSTLFPFLSRLGLETLAPWQDGCAGLGSHGADGGRSIVGLAPREGGSGVDGQAVDGGMGGCS